MFRKISVIFAFVFAAFSLLASPAMAAVTFDPANGTGFVGKGDVQLALGLNNAQLQAQAAGLQFTFESSAVYAVTVEWTTGEGTKAEKTHIVEHKRTISVNDSVNYDARKVNQVTGFLLTGFGSQSESVTVPEVGAAWSNGDGNEATITSVELVSSTGSTLKVNGVELLVGQ